MREQDYCLCLAAEHTSEPSSPTMYTLPVGFFFSALVKEIAEAPPRGVDTEEAIGTVQPCRTSKSN